MEFFLPSLIIFLIGGLLAFFVVPKFSVHVIAILSVALFIFGIYHHMKIFSYEYRYSTWQEQFKEYGYQIMIGAMLLVVTFYLFFLFNKSPSNNGSSSANSSNPITSAMNSISNATGLNNSKKNNATGLMNKINNSVVSTFGNVKSLISGNSNSTNNSQKL